MELGLFISVTSDLLLDISLFLFPLGHSASISVIVLYFQFSIKFNRKWKSLYFSSSCDLACIEMGEGNSQNRRHSVFHVGHDSYIDSLIYLVVLRPLIYLVVCFHKNLLSNKLKSSWDLHFQLSASISKYMSAFSSNFSKRIWWSAWSKGGQGSICKCTCLEHKFYRKLALVVNM